MEPLTKLPVSIVERLRGVIFDVDDTVTTAGRLDPAAYHAMWQLHEFDLTLVAATGRPLGWTDLFAQQWPIDLAVGENGAGWAYLKSGGLVRGYFSTVDERDHQQALCRRVVARVKAEMPHIRLASDVVARRCDLAFDIGEEVQLPEDQRDALVALIESEGARAPYSSVHCHVVAGEWDKAGGICRGLKEALGLDENELRDAFLYVGDSKNDESAFSFFPHSIGVRNIEARRAEMAVLPRYVTMESHGLGFAELADHVLRRR